MTIRRQALVAAAAAALLLGGPAAAQEVKAEEHVLPNGMKLLLVHRPDEPTVSAGWVAKVGSANERVGITGISHLFEHMMFKGTKTIGSKDPKRDLEVIAEQEKLRDEMRAEESNCEPVSQKTAITPHSAIGSDSMISRGSARLSNSAAMVMKYRSTLKFFTPRSWAIRPSCATAIMPPVTTQVNISIISQNSLVFSASFSV